MHIPEAYGIDPDIAWADGQCYITWNAWPSAPVMIRDLPRSARRRDRPLLEPAYPVWQGSGLDLPEGRTSTR